MGGKMQFYRKEKKYTEGNIQDYLRDWIATGNVGKFYGTALWKAKRDEIMRRDGCMCQLCRMQGVQTPAVVVHHIEHVEDNPAAALDDANLLSLCKFCHKVVHKGLAYVLSYWHSPPAWAQDLQQVILYYMRQQQQQQAYVNPSYYFPDTLTPSQPIQSQQQTANQQQQQQQINNIYQRGQYYPYYSYPYPYQPQGQQGQGQQQQQQPYVYPPYQSQQPPQYNPYPYIPGA